MWMNLGKPGKSRNKKLSNEIMSLKLTVHQAFTHDNKGYFNVDKINLFSIDFEMNKFPHEL